MITRYLFLRRLGCNAMVPFLCELKMYLTFISSGYIFNIYQVAKVHFSCFVIDRTIFTCSPTRATHSVQHSGSIWPNSAKNKILWCYFTSFSKQISADSYYFRFRSLYAPCIKICQIVAGVSKISLFQEFFLDQIFGEFLIFGPSVCSKLCSL